MGLLEKLFGTKEPKSQDGEAQSVGLKKGDSFISVGNKMYRIIRKLTDIQREKIENSTIQLMQTQLYMHYWTDNLVCNDPTDQEWQNKVMFFWKAEEPFPKKSLPPHFLSFKVKNFVFVGDTSNISVEVGEAEPWFGMPGRGEKHVCEIDGQPVTIPELNKQGIVDYVELLELTDSNLDVLTEKGKYFFLVDSRITPFKNGSFYLDDRPVPIDVAYSVGGIHIVKSVALE